MKDILKLGIILFLITGICTGLLGGIYQVTKPIIEENNAKTQMAAMQALLTEADDFTEVEGASEGDLTAVYVAQKGSTPIGYVAKIAPVGYGGAIDLLVAFNGEQVVEGIKILSHSETPGFGANAEKPAFSDQFKMQKAPLIVTKVTPAEGEIQAITGATITSTAITEGVNAAAEYIAMHSSEWGDL